MVIFLLVAKIHAQDPNSSEDRANSSSLHAGQAEDLGILARPKLFQPLTEPPCSYCVDQNSKGLIDADDQVIAWIRGAHNGGAIPLRHFLSAPRVINDTYGLFFYDPDGGYVAAYEKDYGYQFYGWRGGVMVVRDQDGTIWSALSGRAIAGPQKGQRLKRIPSLTTTWAHWLMLHPESTAYNLFDGNKYPTADLPQTISTESISNRDKVDERLTPESFVIGIEATDDPLAISLESLAERACFTEKVDGNSIAVFWYGPTHSAVAFRSEIDGQELTFYADEISPGTAPFKDRETGTRWSLAGRGIDGPLRGKELKWVPSIQCRWYAWSHEYPNTRLRKLDSAQKDNE